MFNPPEDSRSGATGGPATSAFGRAADSAAAGADRAAGERVSGRVSGKPIRDAFVAGSASVVQLDKALTRVERAELLVREAEAERLRALAEVRVAAETDRRAENSPVDRGDALEQTLSYRSAVAEVAASLKLTEQTIEQHIEHAATLATLYPTTLLALESGEISSTHARIIVDAGSIIGTLHSPDSDDTARDRGRYEARVLDYAKRESSNRLRPRAKHIAEEYARESLDVRHQRACRRRSVWVRELEDGMAELTAYLSAVDAMAIHSRLTVGAKRVELVEKANRIEAKADGGANAEARLTPRSRAEIRLDLLKDLLLKSDIEQELGDGPEVRAIVQVTTTSEHFTRLTEAFGGSGAGGDAHSCDALPLPLLEGYGPIDVDTVRQLASGADAWNVVSVSEETGDVLSVDRYRPSEELKRFIYARDQHCRFPGCRAAAYRCELDHSQDWAHGGKTTSDNLGALCRGHHMLKHHGGWSLVQLPNADFEWRSPTGRVHIDRPVSRVRFRRAGPEKPDDPGGPGDPLTPLSPRARANAGVSRVLAGVSAPERVDGPHPF